MKGFGGREVSYEDYLAGRDIPTVRRLEKDVKGLDPMDINMLYRMFRDLDHLKTYEPVYDGDLTEQETSELLSYQRYGSRSQQNGIQKRLEEVDRWMREHGLPDIFTDMTDYHQIRREYDYYWDLCAQEEHDREERERQGAEAGGV